MVAKRTKASGVLAYARQIKQMEQSEFGNFLAEATGRPAQPFSQSLVSAWECGRKQPRQPVRDVCFDVVVDCLAEQMAGRSYTAGELQEIMREWLK